jgi:type III secretion system low calcium response chaperone LcrH/SycD
MIHEASDFNQLEKEIAAQLGHSIETLKEAMPSFNEEHYEAFYAIAYDFYDNGKYREAVNYFRFLTMVDHMSKKHWVGLAASLQMMKEYEKALNAYVLVALIDHEDPYIPFYAAECCFSFGDIQRGLEALDSADQLAAGDDKYKGLRNQLAALREAWSPMKER